MKTLAKQLCLSLLIATSQAFAMSPSAAAPQTPPQNASTNNCSYNFINAKSALNADSKDFASIGEVITDAKERKLSQEGVLKKDKIKVEFTTGGCAHYTYTFTFSHLNQDGFTSDQAFAMAIEMLKTTPTTTEGSAQTETLFKAFDIAAKNKIFRPPNQSYDVPCGDAQCTLDASVKGMLKASYNIAL